MNHLLFCFLTRFAYTDEVARIANASSLKRYFLGAFPANHFPKIVTYPACWIWNTDEAKDDGQHWIAIWLTHDTMYFFDSFALTPEHYARTYWRAFAKSLHVTFKCVQTVRYQSNETLTCGMWSLLYLKKKEREHKMPFNYKRKLINDLKLKTKIEACFKKETIDKVYRRKCIKRKGQQKACTFNECFNKN